MADAVKVIAAALEAEVRTNWGGLAYGHSDPNYECPWEMGEIDWESLAKAAVTAMADAHEISEDKAELARHHETFKQISELCEEVTGNITDAYWAIKVIRNLVG